MNSFAVSYSVFVCLWFVTGMWNKHVHSRFMLNFTFMSKNVLAKVKLVVVYIFCHIYTYPFSFSSQFFSQFDIDPLCPLMVDKRVFMCTETIVSVRKCKIINPYYNLFYVFPIFLSQAKRITSVSNIELNADVIEEICYRGRKRFLTLIRGIIIAFRLKWMESYCVITMAYICDFTQYSLKAMQILNTFCK